MPRPFYVTTPIYYVNDVPHIGHAYTTVVADALRRYHALRGEDARMLTGTDEHGLKLERVAAEHKQTPQAFVDAMSVRFRETWPDLHVEPSDFIRTTEPRHKAFAQELWKTIEARGLLYEGQHEGWYCVGCEEFKTEKELLPGNLCDIHKRPVESQKEPMYFFKLSAFQDRLLKFYEQHPTFILPEGRRNEVISFVRGGLRDLGVSRSSFRWGIPVPTNDKHIMYVWFDALSNYRSALAGAADAGGPLTRFWAPQGEVVHLMAKDILRFHAVYWPAFLMAAGYEDNALPTTIRAHGYLTVDGEKMAKTTGNVIEPRMVAREVGADVLRYHLLSAVSFGQDGDFDFDAFIEKYNADLGKNVGNLVQRTIGLCVKLTGLTIPERGAITELETKVEGEVAAALSRAAQAWANIEPHLAMEATMAASRAANVYVDHAAPWAAGKVGDTARVGTILRTLLRIIEQLSIALWPVLPERTQAMRAQLGLPNLVCILDRDAWNAPSELCSGAALPTPTPLFPMYDKEQTAALLARIRPAKKEPVAAATAPGLVETPATKEATPALAASAAPITYEQFETVDLRVGLITAAERVPKKDRLLKLAVDLGEAAPRTIIAGLALSFAPEALVGRRVAVVANLAPRDFGKGLLSHGMLLAAGPTDALDLATIDPRVPPGTRLK